MVKIGPRFSRRRSTPQSIPPSIPPKRALLIGINYTGADLDSDYPPLHRAQDDAKEFMELLISALFTSHATPVRLILTMVCRQV